MKRVRLLIVGNPEATHVGAHFRAAGHALGIPVELCDTRAAFEAPWVMRQWNWRVRGHAPARLATFQAAVLQACERFQPTHVLATGIAPLSGNTVADMRGRGICTLNYLTDDPWNPAHRAGWFLGALSRYDVVFTPRLANMGDLRAVGWACVEFLPFAYNPRVHFPDPGAPEESLASDVMFAGGADADRVPYLAALTQAGLDVRLYGGYWERYPETRTAARGHADLDVLRRAVSSARVCLNLVRRANRDDNVMRSFELPAMRGCILTEDTPTHRAVFGAEGDAVMYFQSVEEMVRKARWLREHPSARQGLANAAHTRVTQGKHSYCDRLETMLCRREVV